MKNNDDTFNFSGFPENGEFEVPDPVKKKPWTPKNPGPAGVDPEMLKKLSGMSDEEIMKSLPPELFSMLTNFSNLMNSSLSSLLNDMSEAAAKEQDGSSEDDEDDTKYESTMDLKYLDPSRFGAYRCEIDPDFHAHLYEFLKGNPANIIAGKADKLIDVAGTEDAKNAVSDLLDHVVMFQLTEVTKKLPLHAVEDFKYIGSSDTHSLFFAKMKDHNLYGFFVGVFKDADTGRYMAYIPEFRNTFWVDSNNEPHLYNINKDDEKNDLRVFTEDRISKEVTFNAYSPDIEDFAVRFVLAPVEKAIITPTQFGTIKNVMPVITKADSIIKVGNITPFDTDQAKQFIFDADLDVNNAPFALYFNFGTTIEKESLQEIAQIFFKVDLNNCPLLQCSDLHYTTDSDHIIYINVELGQF